MSGAGDDLVQEATVHLRAAALEMITAARALLDLTEQLVKDPAPIIAAVASLAAAASRAADAPHAPTAPTAPAAEDATPTSTSPSPRTRVQHIRVS